MSASGWEPRIIGFLCNWCSYAGADKAGAAQTPFAPNMHIVRVMCSGRVDPQHVLASFSKGADGVMVLACHTGDCHYKEGNYRAAQRMAMLEPMLAQLGVDARRVRFDFVSAGEGDKYARLVNEMVETLKELGPLTVSSAAGRAAH